MVSQPANSVNESGSRGLVSFDGTATFSTTSLTQYNVLTGASSNTVNNVSPSTAGYILSSTGTSSQPTFNPGMPIVGFASWGGSGSYFDDTVLGNFTVLRPGTGYINNVLVSWTAPQTVTGMVAGTCYDIYIDSAGTLQKVDASTNISFFTQYIQLFDCLRNSTSPTNTQLTVKENHPYQFPAYVAQYEDGVIGTVFAIQDGYSSITLNGTQGIQINGTSTIYDASLSTTVPDSSGVAVSFNKYFTLGSGKWALYTASATFTAVYNNAGTITALPANKFVVYRLYVSKDNLNSATPIYIAVVDTQYYNTSAMASTAISSGSVASATNELKDLELCQLGYIIYSQASNAIVSVVVSISAITNNVVVTTTPISTVQYNALVGGAGNTITSVAPSATSGVPLISQGSSANPIFGTAVVAGGGTGNASATAYSLICGGTTTTGAFQAVADVAVNQVLTSGGVAALPAFSAYPQISGLGIGASAGSTAGITFDGSNFLNNYVQAGSWTPGISFGGGTTGITFSNQVGKYTRIGNVVFIAFYMQMTNKGSSTGNALITGLPINTSSSSTNNAFSIALFANITLPTSGLNICAIPNNSATTIILSSSISGGSGVNLKDTNFTNTADMVGQGFYFTS